MSTSASNILSFKGDRDALIQQVVSAGELVALVIYAPWCPSCRKLSQELPSISNDFPNVLFLKANIGEAKELCSSFNLTAIPHIKFFTMNGNQLTELKSITGANFANIRAMLTELCPPQ
ncbi:Thioredoxin family protein [Histomonas meleagridis]|uniref:Thioredoxin family protein n=1 Tax=Histomonas meleagridis TaxID=135588 RepID=UPI003559D710|nr:Thioredoxin family protein [Histomonas meleagridis]KAH0797371.1 Thioredoxin family protein [Histomonas meleagridis]